MNRKKDDIEEIYIGKLQTIKYIEEWISNGKSIGTQKTYSFAIQQFLNYLEKKNISYLEDVTPRILLEWQQSLVLECKSATVYSKMGTIKSLFTYIHQAGYISRNPFQLIKLTRKDTSLNYRLPETFEVYALIEAASNERDKLIIETLFKTGLRVSELCAIKKEDIKGHFLTVNGKGGRFRTIILPPSLLNKLLKLFKPNQIYLFASAKNRGTKPLCRQTIQQIIKKYAKKAGVNPNISPHWLRHYHAVESLNHGIPLHVLQKSLGHRDLSTTGLYLDARPTECSSLAFL